MATCEVKIANFGDLIITWTPVGVFEGLAKDSAAVTVKYREDGGDLEMSGDGIHGTLFTDNDYSAEATIKFDESSPTYPQLIEIYERGKGALGTLIIIKSNGETDTLECAFIKDAGTVTDGFRAKNPREVIFHAAKRNFDGAV